MKNTGTCQPRRILSIIVPHPLCHRRLLIYLINSSVISRNPNMSRNGMLHHRHYRRNTTITIEFRHLGIISEFPGLTVLHPQSISSYSQPEQSFIIHQNTANRSSLQHSFDFQQLIPIEISFPSTHFVYTPTNHTYPHQPLAITQKGSHFITGYRTIRFTGIIITESLSTCVIPCQRKYTEPFTGSYP